jgi:hypothetical protein
MVCLSAFARILKILLGKLVKSSAKLLPQTAPSNPNETNRNVPSLSTKKNRKTSSDNALSRMTTNGAPAAVAKNNAPSIQEPVRTPEPEPLLRLHLLKDFLPK